MKQETFFKTQSLPKLLRLFHPCKYLLIALLLFGTAGAASLTASVPAQAASSKEIELSSIYLQCYIGHNQTVTLKNAGGGVRWRVSDPSIASVTGKGTKATVKGKKEGTTKLYASYKGKLYACTLDVYKTGLSISGNVLLTEGKSKTVSFYGVPKGTKSFIHEWTDRTGEGIDNDSAIYWEVEDPSVASIKIRSNNSIVITARKFGHSEFSATYGGCRRKLTVGIIVAETARCVSDIRSISLYYTSFTRFLQVLCFYIPQICALNHAYFFASVLTL